MGRGHEVDVVAAGGLQLQHDVGQLAIGHFPAFAAVADFKILAEVAQEIAMGEEDRSRAVTAHQWGLFAEVGIVAGHLGPGAGPAVADLARGTIHAATARAKGAAGQRRSGLGRLGPQHGSLQGLNI